MSTAKQRLDQLLVARGYFESREKAQRAIMAGTVSIGEQRADKPGTRVPEDAVLQVKTAERYVGRGGLKMEAALAQFGVDPTGATCLDIGASTGGFTDCLLQHGAERVYAVDVNVEQLDWKLRQNPRVIPIERNARELRVEDLPESVDIVVIDVSFISVRKVIAPAIAVAKPRAGFLILIKPQFELRREEIGPGGIVKDKKLHDKAILTVRECVESVGLDYLGVRPSRLLGAEGNQEYFLHARKKPLE